MAIQSTSSSKWKFRRRVFDCQSGFERRRTWNWSSSVAVVMVLLIIVPLAIFNKYQAESQEASK